MNKRNSPRLKPSSNDTRQARVPVIAVGNPYSETSPFNDLGFSLVSPDMVPLQNSLNRSSPNFQTNAFFGTETENFTSSPYRDADIASESHYRSISPCRNSQISPFSNQKKLFTNYKNIASDDNSVNNLFASPLPKQLIKPLNFNYEENILTVTEKDAQVINNTKITNTRGSFDFSLNLYKIPNKQLTSGNTNMRIEAVQPLQDERCFLSIQTELKNLNKIFSLLVKIFTKKEITEEDFDISSNEQKILNYVLHRKFLKRLTSKDFETTASARLSKLIGIIGSKSHKRPEECYKFIFTRVLKFLKRSFKKNFNIKQNLDEQFYGYYFAEIAQKNQEPLENYYYPLTKKENKKETLNSNYFAKIFQSKNFINDLVKYINEHLAEEYKTEIVQKLESLLLKWDPQFIEGEQGMDKYLEEIKHYLTKNKRCKLPWTLDEVKEAVLRVYSLIDTHSSSNLSITLDRSTIFQP